MTAEPITFDLVVDQDGHVGHWLRTEVVLTLDEMLAHPENNLTIDQVRANLAEKHASAAGR